MNNKQPAEQHSGLNVGDIYYVLFRQKWLILSFFALGLLAAGALFIIKPPLYESDATLYIQYVRGVNTASQGGNEPNVQVTDPSGGNVLSTEVKFLTSQDLAREVVSNLGAERILSKFGVAPDTNAAVAVVMKYLITDETPKIPTIMSIGYQHPDPDMAREVLQEIILAYINRSADMRRGMQVSPETLTLEIDQMRDKIALTEKSLRQANQEAGIISSLKDTRQGLNDEFQKLKAEILEQGSRLSEFGAVQPAESVKTNEVTAEVTTNAAPPIPSEVVAQYGSIGSAIKAIQVQQVEGMTKYPVGSPLLQDISNQIGLLFERKRQLESQYPGLPNLGVTVATHQVGQYQPDTTVEDGQTAAKKLKARIDYLQEQLSNNKAEQSKLDLLEPNILELERRKQLQMSQFSTLQTSLEHAMTFETENNSGGIKVNESPTVAVKKHSKTFKKLLMIVLAGGVFGGLGVAFVMEMVLDRSIRRPSDVETKLHLPLFITIPNMNGNGNGHARAALPAHNRRLLKDANDGALVPQGDTPGQTDGFGVAPWDQRNSLRRFYAGLRDRLIVNFEVRNLNHNPKLVAVTSCGRGAGVSSIAAGLAASMSETGDGNVLLVNMRGEQGDALHFYNGKPACGLDDVLASETKENAFVQENLYVASEGGGEGGNLSRILPKRFASLMPKLKASDFDYIIFDMPPVSQTSMTPRLSGLMDMVLLVIESEKTNRDAIQRATALLAESKANVSTVLNKVNTYVPRQLHQEFLDDDAGD